MPIEMSEDVLATFGPRAQPRNHALVRARQLRWGVRKALREVSKHQPPSLTTEAVIGDGLEAAADQFAAHAWAFVDPFYSADFAEQLRAGWPPRAFFDPMKTVLKSYDFGFRWRRGERMPVEVSRFPALEEAYELFRGEQTAKRVNELCDDGIERSCYSLVSTWATPGAALVPHRDAIAVEADGVSFLNFVVFVDGTGGHDGGGTCIMSGNTWDTIDFEPTQLCNSALVYRSAAPFWHGFRPMRPGTFRWTLNAQFAAVDYEP